MTSLPIHLAIGSAASGQSVRDAIASYRRAQYLVAGSAVVSASDPSESLDEEEACISPIEERVDEEFDGGDDHLSPIPHHDFIGQFEWDDDMEPESLGSPKAVVPKLLISPPRERPFLVPVAAKTPDVHESTPLLRRAVSFSIHRHDHRASDAPPIVKDSTTPVYDQVPSGATPLPRRRLSGSSAQGIGYTYRGQSTFGQTLFNSIAILLGIGMLSEPLAFSYAGWLAGTVLNVFYGFITCYTAKILARIILSDPRLRSYADIGRKAFGPRSTLVISIMFCLELFAVSVILVTLYADSLHSIFPQHTANTYKLWGLVLLVPTVFLPLSLLSYTSILGIISTLLVIAVIFIDGFSKPEGPGSFWAPAETSVGIDNLGNFGIAFGLFMAGFSGHAVIPSLVRDMIDPGEFDQMINWAFVIATLIYTIIGYAGYLMFGMFVSDEISVDLLKTAGYNPILNQAALWMLVISPLSKFALTTQPLNATISILLGIDPPFSSPEDLAERPNGLSISPQGSYIMLKRILAVLQRAFLTLLSVGVSILVPEFSAMMAFLGSFSAFILCVIGPIMAKVVIAGRCSLLDGVVLVVASVMAVWGILAAAFVSS